MYHELLVNQKKCYQNFSQMSLVLLAGLEVSTIHFIPPYFIFKQGIKFFIF